MITPRASREPEPTDPRAARPAALSRPLQTLLDLPLKADIPPAFAQQIDALRGQISQRPDEALAHHQQAIALVEGLVAHLDGELEALQRAALSQEDPTELKQRIAGGPKREAEKLRGELRQQLGRVVKEWVERAGRQRTYVARECQEILSRELTLTTTKTHAHLEETFFPRFSGFVLRAAQTWTARTLEEVEAALQEQVRAYLVRLGSLTDGSQPRLEPLRAPATELYLKAPLEGGAALELPGMGTVLMQTIRSNLMAVGILGTVAGGIIGLLGFQGGLNARSLLYLVALPPIGALAYLGARKERHELTKKRLEDLRQKAHSELKSQLESGLAHHRGALARCVDARGQTCLQAAEAHYEQSVQPKLDALEAQANNAAKELRLLQTRASEQQSTLKSFRSQLAQTLLFELRRQHRELLGS